MTIIAIDTCLGAASFAVRGPDGVEVSVTYEPHARIGERLLVDIDRALKEAGRPVTSIIATIGPGSYTGQRLGVAAAQGLAAATPGVQCHALTSLHAMFLALRAGPVDEVVDGDAPIWVLADGRGGFVYAQAFDLAGRALGECRIERLADVQAGVLAGRPLTPQDRIVCASPSLHGELGLAGETEVTAVGDHRFDTSRLAEGTAPSLLDALDRQLLTRVTHFRPLYLRPPDATPARSEGLRQKSVADPSQTR